MRDTQLLIVGAGAAGLACAKSAYAAGLRDIVVADCAERPGGILPQCLHTGFGETLYGREMSGPELLARLMEAFPREICLCLNTTVLRLNPDRTALLSAPEGVETVRFRQLILATGCRERSIWSLPVAGTRPSGVMTAGLAQQLINLDGAQIGGRTVIVGSGDVGLVMAGRLAELGRKPLAIIEQQACIGGLARNRRRFAEAYEIPVMLRSEIIEIHGARELCGVTVRHTDTGATENLPCDTLITALGMIPEQSLLKPLYRGTSLPDWVQLAGNCDFVHDIVDRVLRTGETVGASAAERIRKRKA